MDAVSRQQATSHQSKGAFHSPEGEGLRPAQPSPRKRSDTSHRGDSPPTAPKPKKPKRTEARERSKRLVAAVDLEVVAPVQPATWPELRGLLWEAGCAVPEAQRAVVSHLIARDVRQDRQDVALATEAAGRIDLLLTDVVMPEMNGAELSRKLRALRLRSMRWSSAGCVPRRRSRQGCGCDCTPATWCVWLARWQQMPTRHGGRGSTRRVRRRAPPGTSARGSRCTIVRSSWCRPRTGYIARSGCSG